MRSTKQRLGCLLAGIVAVTIAVPFSVIALIRLRPFVKAAFASPPHAPRPFDSEEWKSHDGLNAPLRAGMAADLIGSRILLGKTRSEVLNLLGHDYQSSLPDGFLAIETVASRDLIYTVGESETPSKDWFDPPIVFTTGVVVVHFSPNDVVSSAEIVRLPRSRWQKSRG